MPEYPTKIPSLTKTWHHSPGAELNPLAPTLSAQGKVVLVTGGGTGIGKATAIAFAQAKARAVIITGRTPSSLDAAKIEIEQAAKAQNNQNFECLPLRVDVTDVKATDDAFLLVTQKFGRIDVLISNAGYLDQQLSIADSDLDDYWQSYEINVKGALIVTRAFVKTHPRLKAPAAISQDSTIPKPVIVNISSGACHVTTSMLPSLSAYATSKLAALQIFAFLQGDYRDSLSVFSLQPGEVQTAMAAKGGRDSLPDDPSLPAHWCVWFAAKADTDAAFLKGRLTWANWDLEEFLALKEEVEKEDLLTIDLKGWGKEFAEHYVD